MSQVVFRIAKIKSTAHLKIAEEEQKRLRRFAPHADPIRSPQNIWIRSPREDDIVKELHARIGPQHVRKNAVLAVEVIISASPEYFRPDAPDESGTWDADRLADWRQEMEPWIAQRFPHAASIVLHLDESTPHYQILDTPLDDNGKLNCRGKYGGVAKLSRWQTDAANAVARLGIERGIMKSQAEHVTLREFYGRIKRQTPKLPPRPRPLPKPTIAEQLPLGEPARKRAAAEQAYAAAVAARQAAIAERNAVLEAKAAAFDLAESQRKSALDAAVQAQKRAEIAERRQTEAEQDREQAKAAAKAQADRLRAIDPATVLLDLYSAQLEPDSRFEHASQKWITATGQKIGVTGALWVDQSSGRGGKSAIDLVMRLDNTDFKGAVQILASRFDHGEITRDLVARAELKAASIVRSALDAPPEPAPAPEPRHWPRVRTWLTNVRRMPTELIDRLHSLGSVYAGAFANAVFPRVDGGAFLRGTGESPFKRTLGGKNGGPMVLLGSGAVWLCEGPLDGLAIKSRVPDAHVLALGGGLLKASEVGRWMPKGREIVLAFDTDEAGRRYEAEALAAYPAARVARPPLLGRDWGDCPADPADDLTPISDPDLEQEMRR